MIDLTINKTGLEHNIERAKAQNIIIPTLEEMQHPEKVPEKIQEKLKGVGLWDINPLNLFRIYLAQRTEGKRRQIPRPELSSSYRPNLPA
jgi:hypothetical protein